VVACGIEFETNGPLAVPLRFLERRRDAMDRQRE
jgi:hypothetical protein